MTMFFGTIALSLMGMYGFRPVDPYMEKVFALPGNTAQGHAIFQMNCATCHGILADGLVGPSLKEVSHPNPQEMADLLSYLQSL